MISVLINVASFSFRVICDEPAPRFTPFIGSDLIPLADRVYRFAPVRFHYRSKSWHQIFTTLYTTQKTPLWQFGYRWKYQPMMVALEGRTVQTVVKPVAVEYEVVCVPYCLFAADSILLSVRGYLGSIFNDLLFRPFEI